MLRPARFERPKTPSGLQLLPAVAPKPPKGAQLPEAAGEDVGRAAEPCRAGILPELRLLLFLAVKLGLAEGLGAAHWAAPDAEDQLLAPVLTAVCCLSCAAGVVAAAALLSAGELPAAAAGRLGVCRFVPVSFLAALLPAPLAAAAGGVLQGVLVLLLVAGLLMRL